MTKTKFKVDIHKQGGKSADFLRAIANHNGGIVPLCLEDFISYIQFEKALYPVTNKETCIERDEQDKHIIRVSEDNGETWTLTIEEIEVHELQEEPIAPRLN